MFSPFSTGNQGGNRKPSALKLAQPGAVLGHTPIVAIEPSSASRLTLSMLYPYEPSPLCIAPEAEAYEAVPVNVIEWLSPLSLP